MMTNGGKGRGTPLLCMRGFSRVAELQLVFLQNLQNKVNEYSGEAVEGR